MATNTLFSLNDMVKLRKNDLKSKKKADTFTNIVKFAFQQLVSEGEYAAELLQGKRDVVDLCKQTFFRNQLMLLIEAQLSLGGHNHIAAVIGNNFSVEIKISRQSLMVFQICKTF